MQCKRCKTFFKYDKYDGICPQCAYFNRPPGMEEVDLFEDDKRFQTENYVLPQMEGIHMEPVSYTHLTLPTICSV